MKNWIRNSLQLTMVAAMSVFMLAMLPTSAEAQGRQRSNSGKSQTVERKSSAPAKEKAAKTSRTSTPKKAVKRSSGSSTSSRSKTTSRSSQKKSSNSGRVIKRESSSSGSSSSSTGRTNDSARSRTTSSTASQTPKSVKRVVIGSKSGDSKSGDSSSGRKTVDRGSDRSSNGDSGVRGSGGSDSRASGRDNDARNSPRNGGVVNNNGRGSSGITVTRDGNRSRYTGPVIKHPNKTKKYKHNGKHKWQHSYFRPDRVHVSVHPKSWHRHVHVSSHVHLGFRWPWQYRVQHHWRPRYRYRQVIYVNVGWGSNQRRSRIDVRTYYNQRVRHANSEYAEIEIDIDAIELFQDGRFIGYVDKIPSSLREINAVVYANGRVEFDRNVFLVGDTYRGFEMISTRYYDDYLLNAYDRGHDVRVGRLDLRKERVKKIRRSRLFNPYNFNGNVPHSLLPEDDRLFDYSYEYFSGYYRDGNRGYDSGYFGQNYNSFQDYESGMSRIDEVSYSTQLGASVDLTRESIVERIDN